MELNTIWFILIGILYTGFFVLEGFDLGVGLVMPFLRKDDNGRRVIINTVGPHWDGNEVWLITAGGATFAAFPQWYATLFSGFYLPLFLILLGLILRGVGFEFRSKDLDPRWRRIWDVAIWVGCLLPALLFGVAFANFVRGVPINAEMQYVGGFWNLLSPYALLGGLLTLVGFSMHGAIFLSMKTTAKLSEDARRLALRLWAVTAALYAAVIVYTYLSTNIADKLGVVPGVIPVTAFSALLLAGYFIRVKRVGWAFLMNVATIAFTSALLFLFLYPNVLPSSLNPAWSLTVFNAASSPYTLRIMTIIAAIFVPIVLAYQGWTYYVFRKRLNETGESLHY